MAQLYLREEGQLLLPDSYVQESYRWLRENGYDHLLPYSERRKVLLAANGQAIRDLPEMAGGRAARPTAPVVIYGPDGRTPIIIPTFGTMEAAEVEDLALGAYEKAQKAVERQGSVIDHERLRAEGKLN